MGGVSFPGKSVMKVYSSMLLALEWVGGGGISREKASHRGGSVAYPELVSRGVSERRKCKWLVRVGASITVSPPDLKKNHSRGGFPGNQKTPLDTPLGLTLERPPSSLQGRILNSHF